MSRRRDKRETKEREKEFEKEVEEEKDEEEEEEKGRNSPRASAVNNKAKRTAARGRGSIGPEKPRSLSDPHRLRRAARRLRE